jgi:hypothetical protein
MTSAFLPIQYSNQSLPTDTVQVDAEYLLAILKTFHGSFTPFRYMLIKL